MRRVEYDRYQLEQWRNEINSLWMKYGVSESEYYPG